MQVLTVKYIAQSLERLRKTGVHRNTIMYLCVKRAATQQNTTDNIKLDFREFFERFLTVRDAPIDRLNKPYIIPFESSDAKLWLNRNLAGSFAPSSIRPDNPINTVISLNGNGAGVRYTLKPNHGQKAFNNLLNGEKLPVAHLAVFLYRDFGFDLDSMNLEKLVEIFKSEFGYSEYQEDTPDFDDVFSSNIESAPEDLFSRFFEN